MRLIPRKTRPCLLLEVVHLIVLAPPYAPGRLAVDLLSADPSLLLRQRRPLPLGTRRVRLLHAILLLHLHSVAAIARGRQALCIP